MNLRQKAKYYKKKYLQNKGNYYDRTLFSAPAIQTEKLVATTIIPAENVYAIGTDADDVIANILVNTMKEEIKPYLHINSIYNAPTNTYQFFASVRLVKGVEHDF